MNKSTLNQVLVDGLSLAKRLQEWLAYVLASVRYFIPRLLFGKRDWLRPRKVGQQYFLLLTAINFAVWSAQMLLFEYFARGTHLADAAGFIVIISAFVTIVVYMIINERLWITREYAHASFLAGGVLLLTIARLFGY